MYFEVHYGHKKNQDGMTYKTISFGHGIPTHGQLHLIGHETVYMNNDGEVVHATLDWKFPTKLPKAYR